MWRKLLSLREKFRTSIRFLVGNGLSTFLWFDYWLPIGPLNLVLDERLLAESGIPRNTKVSHILCNGRWRWPGLASADLLPIKQVILSHPIPDISEPDVVRWELDRAGQFTIKSAWNSIRTRKEKVDWYHLIWFPAKIPKTAFCLWLAVKGHLDTQDRLPTLW